MIYLGPPLLFIGIIDASIASALFTATSIEASYVGTTKRECAQLSPNGTSVESLIFFERARVINSTNPNYGVELCNGFMAKFYLGIVIA